MPVRVLTSAVLAFEWIVLALGIPVAVNVSGVPAGRAWIVFGLATVLTVAAFALMKRPAGVWLGWGVQAVAIAAGMIVPMLGILGVIFAGLYFAAISTGRRVDAIRAQRADAEAGQREPAPAGPSNREAGVAER